MLVNSSLRDRFDLRVIRSNVRDSNADKGRWDAAGIFRVLSVAVRLWFHLVFRRPGVVYLTLSQNHSGLARDVLYMTICRLSCVPYVLHLHGSLLPEYLATRRPMVRSFLERIIRRSAHIVVCGESIASGLRPTFGDKVAVVANSTPPEAFLPSERREPGLTVAFMAHLSQAKGFYDLLSAARRVLDLRPGARFLFAGERLDIERNVSPGAEKAPDWSEFTFLETRNPGHVRWMGVVTGIEKTDFLGSSDLFVLPSHAEAFPVAILEAMAASLPVIATPVGAVPDIVRPGSNGELVPAGDSEALARAIVSLLDDEDRRRRLGRGALATAREFSVQRQSEAIGNLLASAADRGACFW